VSHFTMRAVGNLPLLNLRSHATTLPMMEGGLRKFGECEADDCPGRRKIQLGGSERKFTVTLRRRLIA
jgi:hypothetical protein